MFRSSTYPVLAALLIAGTPARTVIGQPTASKEPTVAPETQLNRQIADLVTKYAELDMFSGIVLVAQKEHVIYEGAFGEANKDYHIPNRMSTRFNIGSIGKTFTAVAIMQLVEAGKVRLQDPLSKFLPDFPFPEKDTITLHHLLNHTSGLGDYLEHKDYRSRMTAFRTIDDALPLVYDQKPDFSAGERFQYSNSGYLLLGAIIEKVTGLSYPDYLSAHIFQPLGMTGSSLTAENEVLPDRSIGYTKRWDETYSANVLIVPRPCPAGGLRTTARDLLKFDQALYGTELLSEESKAKMFAPSSLRPTYGYGWEIKEYHGHRFVGHSGGTDGVEAFFYRFVDSGYTIITLANYDGGNGRVCSDIEAILFGQPYSLPTMADAHFTLGYALQSAGKHEEAVKVFSKNLQIDPPHLLSLFLCANSRIHGNIEVEKSIAELDRYIELAGQDAWPPPAMAWSHKGSAFQKLGKVEEASRCYRKVLELDPENTKAKEKLEKLQAKPVKR